ncbi:protein translocase subunit SecF [Pseudoalteromonas sp. T1lg10]|uniref:protein translocase subunit SecF n=1 Tax=Pseudoalteromonas sp. T1lg10 TaxID=2077093 RepID=UPI000CF6C4D6|nr:protein translocase subunit SecF [Pseudoalteromonas sp. T1lg10]
MVSNFKSVRKFGLWLSVLLMVVSLLIITLKGVPLGQDFTGGYVSEFALPQSVAQEPLQQELGNYIDGPFRLTERGPGQWSVFQTPEAGRASGDWLASWSVHSGATVLDNSFLGAAAGDELIEQGMMALLFATLAVMLYLLGRFEWRLSVAATLALAHDVIITLALLALFEVEFTLTVLAAILAIIGYSLNDSIVIGDKVREIVRAKPEQNVSRSVNEAIFASMSRTLITSLTTLTTIISIWMMAGAPLRGFAITLFVGVLVGTWSSVFISATLPQSLGLSSDNYLHKDSEEIKRQLAEP